MTREEILAMVPGRELDALVAEKVMGWSLQGDTEWVNDEFMLYEVEEWKPSTDISAAWEVVEKMHQQSGISIALDYDKPAGKWSCEFDEWGTTQAEAATAQEAIVKSALLAVMDA